jgi:hypothetical protein
MPTDLDGQILPKHLMRVVSTAIDKMNLPPLEAQYEHIQLSSQDVAESAGVCVHQV